MKRKIFLGGTCNGSLWRNKFISKLDKDKFDYFDPALPVGAWNEEAYQQELKEREECDLCLYLITPLMAGVYSIAEVVEDSIKRSEKTIFCFLSTDVEINPASFDDNSECVGFLEDELKSLNKVGVMVQQNGGMFIKENDISEIVEVINDL